LQLFYYIMRKISIRVVPNASRNEVIKEEDGSLKVRVTAKAAEGKANKAVIEVLADYFGIKKSQVRIVMGEKARNKVVEINS
jgi:uncharacterized protein